MKTLSFLTVIAAAIFLTGCGNNSSSSSGQGATTGTSVTNTLAGLKNSSDGTIDVSYLNSALALYNTQEGHYPKTLDELKPNYVQQLPILPPGTKLDYDSTNGTVKILVQ